MAPRSLLSIVIVGGVLLMMGFPARAADLLTSWQSARTHDAVFSAARNALRAGEENALQGDAALRPQINLAANADELVNRTSAPPSSNATGGSQQGQRVGAGLSLVQPLYNAGLTSRRSSLHLQSEQAEIQYRIAEQDLILRVAKAYFDVLLANDNLKLVAAQKEAIALQLAIAKKSFEIGAANITDTNDAKARFDAIAASEITARNDQAIKANSFRLLTAENPDRLVALPSSLDLADLPPAAMQAWLAAARSDNLAVKAQQFGVAIAGVEIDRYRLDATPVLSLVAGYGNQIDSAGLARSGTRERTTNASIGLQLVIPLYDGGLRTSQYRQTVALRDQQRETLEAVQRDAEQTALQSFLGVSNGAAQLRALDQARLSSLSSLNSSKLGREVGARTSVDVLNAEQNYYQVLTNLAVARYQYLLNKLQLAAAVGSLNDTALAEVNALLVGQNPPVKSLAK